MTLCIDTERLRLFPLFEKDTEALHVLWTQPDVRQFLWDGESIPPEQTAEVVAESERLFRESGLGLWSAHADSGSGMIGFCGYWYFHEPPELQVLYGLSPDQWGRGLATEAACAMIRYGFETLGLKEVIGSTDVPNLASVRVMEKAGMSFQKRVSINGLDTLYYRIESILPFRGPHGYRLFENPG